MVVGELLRARARPQKVVLAAVVAMLHLVLLERLGKGLLAVIPAVHAVAVAAVQVRLEILMGQVMVAMVLLLQ
jgi:hypothetical protein